MTSYEMELLVQDRMQALREEAERERFARLVEGAPKRGRTWRTRVSLSVVVRRLARAAQAS